MRGRAADLDHAFRRLLDEGRDCGVCAWLGGTFVVDHSRAVDQGHTASACDSAFDAVADSSVDLAADSFIGASSGVANSGFVPGSGLATVG